MINTGWGRTRLRAGMARDGRRASRWTTTNIVFAENHEGSLVGAVNSFLLSKFEI
jgi:hypothetical protein